MIPSLIISIVAFFWMICGIQITENQKKKIWDKSHLIVLVMGWPAIFFNAVKIKKNIIPFFYWFAGTIVCTTLLLVLPFHLYKDGTPIIMALSILITEFLLSAVITLAWWVIGFLAATWIVLCDNKD